MNNFQTWEFCPAKSKVKKYEGLLPTREQNIINKLLKRTHRSKLAIKIIYAILEQHSVEELSGDEIVAEILHNVLSNATEKEIKDSIINNIKNSLIGDINYTGGLTFGDATNVPSSRILSKGNIQNA